MRLALLVDDHEIVGVAPHAAVRPAAVEALPHRPPARERQGQRALAPRIAAALDQPILADLFRRAAATPAS